MSVIDKINISQVFWNRYVAESARRPGGVLGSNAFVGPVEFLDLAYPISTYCPAPETSRSYVSYFLYSLHDGRILFSITHLEESADRSTWRLSPNKSYCMIDNNLQHMIRFGMDDEHRLLLKLDYDTSLSEDEIISFIRKTQGSLQPIKAVV